MIWAILLATFLVITQSVQSLSASRLFSNRVNQEDIGQGQSKLFSKRPSHELLRYPDAHHSSRPWRSALRDELSSNTGTMHGDNGGPANNNNNNNGNHENNNRIFEESGAFHVQRPNYRKDDVVVRSGGSPSSAAIRRRSAAEASKKRPYNRREMDSSDFEPPLPLGLQKAELVSADEERRMPIALPIKRIYEHEATDKSTFGDVYFVAIVAGCSAAAIFGVISAGYCFYKFQQHNKAAADVEYPAYGVVGPAPNKNESIPATGTGNVSPSGDRKLAQSAQMYHYHHQKQQMIASEKALPSRHTSASDADSDEEGEEGEYTVYECPGLAPTGEMEVKNPLFQDDITPVSTTPPPVAHDKAK